MSREPKDQFTKGASEGTLVARRQRALARLIDLLGDDYRRILERDRRLRKGRSELESDEPIGETLRRLRHGEITVAQYLDIKVDLAVDRVRGLLPEDDFRYVRAMIRDRVETDPVLVELVRRLVPSDQMRGPHN